MVGTCLSIGDLCCLVGFDARPLERDLDLESFFDLELVFDDVGQLRTCVTIFTSFKLVNFFVVLVPACSF